MARDFHAQSIPLPKFPMSAFDMGYSLKLVSNIGNMNVHYVEECIPSDIAHIKTDIFVRLDPLTFPIMHKIKVRQNFFFVPTRLILGDDLMEKFNSGNDLDAHLPKLTISDVHADFIGKNTIFDQMECQPVEAPYANEYVIRNPIPFYMVQRIWADWYADEILERSDIQTVDGMIEDYRAAGLDGSLEIADLSDSPFVVHRVSYSKDRFTSAQPDAQRMGEVYVMNPLTVARVDGVVPQGGSALYAAGASTPGVSPGNIVDGGNNLYRSSLTVDELWDEMAVQRYLNSLNEFGNERYVEILAGQYGVISADARLQRPQWLGGNEMVVNISEVLQTSESTNDSPLGAFGGRGIVAGRGRDIAFKVPEHGFIIGILTFVPENGYASGSPRWLYKSTLLDFALPRFNNLGEQVVYNGELFSDHLGDADTNDLSEFAYQPQFDEYRSHPSRATGDFRDSQFLSWHLDRKFTQVPALNKGFINIDPSVTNRIFNVTDGTSMHLRTHCFHKAMYVRPISKHPIPGKL